MMDGRSHLPNGALNPDYRKYKRFDLYADVVQRWFELFKEQDGNLSATWRRIEHEGPYLPDIPKDAVLEGFQVTDHLKRRSSFTGGLTPAQDTLRNLLVNVAYIGHWVHKGAITQFNNHEAIIPLDLFLYAYNRISATDFYGEPNPQYVPYRPWIRHDREDREEPKPTYAYLAYSDDLPEYPHKRLACVWAPVAKQYKYQLAHYPYESNLWNIKAAIVDALVDEMVLERLKATTIDDGLWQAALASLESVDQAEVRRIQAAIRQAEQTKDNLIASLGLLTHAEMVARAEARYEAAERELESLRAELSRIQANEHQSRSLVEARPVLETIIARWDEVPREEKRDLFEQFGQHITISKLTRHTKQITVHWRDGSISERSTTHRSLGYFWDDEDIGKLYTMIENDVDQVWILRAFPDYQWNALTQRMRYHFGKGWWKTYKGEKKYPRNTTWADTEEAQAEATETAQQLMSSRGCSVPP